jgi:hypothetical protein
LFSFIVAAVKKNHQPTEAMLFILDQQVLFDSLLKFEEKKLNKKQSNKLFINV